MAFSVRKALGMTSALGLVVSLAACGPDDMAVKDAGHFALGDVNGPFAWPMDGYESAPGSASTVAQGDWAPLGAARPMVAHAPARYGYARAWNYADDYRYDAPEFASYDDGDYADGYYDGGYYEDSYYDSPYFENAFYGPAGYDWYDRSPDTGTYALLALAAVLGGVIGDSPPDYYFAYDNVQPWVWITDDRYVRYAEPLENGYRYYYYAPDAVRPFLVRDPLYTYGYNGDQLVVIYDTYGRVLDRDRALPLRRAASSYYDRGVTLYQAGMTGEQYGVSAPLWQQRSAALAADQQVWNRASNWSPGWRDWYKRYDDAVGKHWKRERIARTYAAKRFAAWEGDGYRSAAPQPRRELREKGNPYQAVLQQAAVETRRQDMHRLARQEHGKAQLRSDRAGQSARSLVTPVRETAANARGGAGDARLQGRVRAERQDNRPVARSGGERREDAIRGQGNVSRNARVERQAEARALRQDKAVRERQAARPQREARQEQAHDLRRRADVQRQQRAERQQQAQRQQVQRQQQESRRNQANVQRQQQTERRQQAQARGQQETRRQQMNAQREQQVARQQQVNMQRQQQGARRNQANEQRNQQANAQRQQQIAYQQHANAQRQQQAQQIQRQQQAQQVERQQPERQAFANGGGQGGDPGHSGGQGRGHRSQ